MKNLKETTTSVNKMANQYFKHATANYSNVKMYCGCKHTFITYTGIKNNPYLFVISDRAKNEKQFRFSTSEMREQYIDSIIEREQSHAELQAFRKQQAQEKKDMIAAQTKVGSLFSSSWGYDQTNVNIYQVTKKISKYRVEVREIGKLRIEGSDGFDSCYVKADVDNFIGEPIVKTITKYGIKDGHYTATPANKNTEHYCSWYA